MPWRRNLTRTRLRRPEPCRCEYGRFPDDDPLGRDFWIQVTSRCRAHFSALPLSVRVRILINEGFVPGRWS